jgi:hypothetical protein
MDAVGISLAPNKFFELEHRLTTCLFRKYARSFVIRPNFFRMRRAM